MNKQFASDAQKQQLLKYNTTNWFFYQMGKDNVLVTSLISGTKYLTPVERGLLWLTVLFINFRSASNAEQACCGGQLLTPWQSEAEKAERSEAHIPSSCLPGAPSPGPISSRQVSLHNPLTFQQLHH